METTGGKEGKKVERRRRKRQERSSTDQMVYSRKRAERVKNRCSLVNFLSQEVIGKSWWSNRCPLSVLYGKRSLLMKGGVSDRGVGRKGGGEDDL